MTYNQELWKKRYKYRSDISSCITHFTKESSEKKASENLIKILNEKKIIASKPYDAYIVGTDRAVCFQEAPTESLCQSIIFEQDNREILGNKIRYLAFGISFSKIYCFQKGVRPVLYEKKDIAKKILPQDEHWRIVNFDLSDTDNIIDWTHEREWRCKGDFEFDYCQTMVYLPNEFSYKEFIDKINPEILRSIKGIVVLGDIIS